MAEKLGTEIHYNGTREKAEERFGWIVSTRPGDTSRGRDESVDIAVLDSDNDDDHVSIVRYNRIPYGMENGQWHRASECPNGL